MCAIAHPSSGVTASPSIVPMNLDERKRVDQEGNEWGEEIEKEEGVDPHTDADGDKGKDRRWRHIETIKSKDREEKSDTAISLNMDLDPDFTFEGASGSIETEKAKGEPRSVPWAAVHVGNIELWIMGSRTKEDGGYISCGGVELG